MTVRLRDRSHWTNADGVFAAGFLIFGGRHTHERAKSRIKMTDAIEPDIEGGFSNARTGQAKVSRGTVNSVALKVFYPGHAKCFVEQHLHTRLADSGRLGDIARVNRFIVVLTQVMKGF